MKITIIKVFLFLFCLAISTPFISPLFAGEPSNALPAELMELEIRDRFIKSSLEEVGAITTITGKGKLAVVHRADQTAYYANEGDPIYENDALYSLTDCRCRLGFKDKNVVIMAPDTHLDIDEVSASIIKGKKKSIFGMTKGKAIFYALRLFRYKEMSLQLETPNASIGVRGTKFGTEIVKIKEDQSNILNRMLASRDLEFVEMGSGKQNIITRAYVFEGEIMVTSLIDGRMKRLRENEILEADQRGLGEVKFDPARTKSFFEDVAPDVVSAPKPGTQKTDREFYREELDRMEKMNDIRQREMQTHPSEPAKGHDSH